MFPVDRISRKHRGARSRQSVARCPTAYVAQWPRLAERMLLTPASLSGPAEHMVLIIASSLTPFPPHFLDWLITGRTEWAEGAHLAIAMAKKQRCGRKRTQRLRPWLGLNSYGQRMGYKQSRTRAGNRPPKCGGRGRGEGVP